MFRDWGQKWNHLFILSHNSVFLLMLFLGILKPVHLKTMFVIFSLKTSSVFLTCLPLNSGIATTAGFNTTIPEQRQQSPQRNVVLNKSTGMGERSASNVTLQTSTVHFSFAPVFLFLLCGKNTQRHWLEGFLIYDLFNFKTINKN